MRTTRRRTGAVLAAGLGLAIQVLGPAAFAGDPPHTEVDVFVGTGGAAPWRGGATTPAAAVPFGMVQLGPDTTDDEQTGAPSAAPSGYAVTDRFLRGFSAVHLSGAGCPTFGDAPILPVAGAVPDVPASATTAIDRATERAAPGRYAVSLMNGISVKAAVGDRSGLLRFAYPSGTRSFVVVKADGSLAGSLGQRVSFPSDHEIAVRVRSGRFCDGPNQYVAHVLYRFDHSFRSRGGWDGGAWVGFGRRRALNVQVAVSFVGPAGARRNLGRSDPGWSVGRLAARAAAAWDAELARVDATGGNPTTRRLLRTALYHVLLHPNPVSDVDGRYPGFDGRVHRLRGAELQLSSISGWDVYRTEIPLLAWLRPDIASMIVRSMRRDAVQGGWFPRWPVVGADSRVMRGDPAGPIAAAAWAFGARDFPLEDVVARLVRQGDRVDGPRERLDEYLRLGWVPAPDERHGASITLEYAAADFAISRLAAAAGQDAAAARYRERSGSWRTLLDPSRGLLLPRDGSGAFPPPDADVTACCAGFEEGNALQYTFGGVPQDMAGLLAALGPSLGVRDRLDEFFEQLNVGGGPHAWLGNEPSFLTPWSYQWLGAPARTQDVVARARAELWSLSPSGLPGNDDLGALSAWYVWTSLGLYPLTPGTPHVAVGVPAFERLVLRPLGGPITRIERSGAGSHVAGLRMDGGDRTASWIGLSVGDRPRLVEIATTDDAAPAWGTAPADRPPSYPGS